MSTTQPDGPAVPASAPSSAPATAPAVVAAPINPSSDPTPRHRHDDDYLGGAPEAESEADVDPAHPPEPTPSLRAVIRLLQCRRCSHPVRDPVTLPCGRSLCRSCLPATHSRPNVSYPATAERARAFTCPFPAARQWTTTTRSRRRATAVGDDPGVGVGAGAAGDEEQGDEEQQEEEEREEVEEGCGREHVLADCAVDVTLNKVIEHARDIFVHAENQDSTAPSRPEDAAASSPQPRPLGKLATTYSLASAGSLAYDADVVFTADDDAATNAVTDAADATLLRALRNALRAELDCQVCYALLHRPLTTLCGHTFCAGCLERALDHARYCPLCRRPLSLVDVRVASSSSAAASQASQTVGERTWRRRPGAGGKGNATLEAMVQTLFPAAAAHRRETAAAEARAAGAAGSHAGGGGAGGDDDYDIPLFVCTLSFPLTPTFLHVFEPRYRLMIRRALEGDRTFGMVLHRPWRPGSGGSGDGDGDGGGRPSFMELGTLLRIRNVEYFVDGRSLIETVGVSRFRVTRHGVLDGYSVAGVEMVDDIALDEEEAREIAETRGWVGGAAEAATTTAGSTAETTPRPTVSDDGLADETMTGMSSTTPTGESPAAIGEDSGAPPTSEHQPAAPTPSPARPPPPRSRDDLEHMPTRDLMTFAEVFVRRMKRESAPWLAHRILAIYGECPTDPAVFPWWFASILPIRDEEKYRLLGTNSVRERLKICCGWIMDWESTTTWRTLG